MVIRKSNYFYYIKGGFTVGEQRYE